MKKLDWTNILKSWQSATSSTFSSRRGKNEPTLLKIDELLDKYIKASRTSQPAQLACLHDLCFTLQGWIGKYDGSRLEAAKQLLEDAQARRTELKDLGTAQDLAHWPKQPMPAIGAAPLHVAMNKFPGDKYFTLGMQVQGGLGKDLNNQALVTNRKNNEDSPAAWKGLVYMNERERVRFLVTVKGGLLYHETAPDKVMDTDKSHITTKKVSNGMYIFVMDGKGRIFSAAKDDVEHHSSFLAGNPCGAAGTLNVTGGKLGLVTNQSGHYCPAKDYIDQFVAELRSRGADVSGLKLGEMGTRAKAQATSAARGIKLGLRLYPSGPRNEGC